MSNNFIKHVAMLVLLCSSLCCEAYLTKTNVRVTNDLGQGFNLTIHCKSKDDDLGTRVLKYKEYFEWQFRANIWGSTLFLCDMQWQRANGSFRVYEQVRDEELCGSKCYWYVRPNGACLHSDETHRDYCFDWRKVFDKVHD